MDPPNPGTEQVALSGSGGAGKVNVCSEKKLSTSWIFRKWILLFIFSFLISPSLFSLLCVFGSAQGSSCAEKGERAARIPDLVLENTWAFSSHKFTFLEDSLAVPAGEFYERRIYFMGGEGAAAPACALVKGNGSAGCAQGILREMQEIPPAGLSSLGGAQGCVWAWAWGFFGNFFW